MPGDPVETWNSLYREAAAQLASPFEAGQLLFHVAGIPANRLPLMGGRVADPACGERLRALCKRRLEGEPLQYLLGEWEFYGLPFQVGPGVLIPRPDTEILVETALELYRAHFSAWDEPPEILDLCSGSGCVAVALALNTAARVTAVEKSPQAFPYLEANAARNNAPLRAVLADLHTYAHPAPIHLLVSNPPYIPREDLPRLQREVAREPILALDGGPDGLDFYRAILDRFVPALAPGGWICFEVGMGQSGDAARLLERAGLGHPLLRKDLSGIERVVAARRPWAPPTPATFLKKAGRKT